ncbi:MAG: outer membrane protein multidrug efflux system, partial [Solirubrobacteraceae bacterium]|nr:outer membrane protein multidrug efflux system [Solirubrobacteraceae bacterium]
MTSPLALIEFPADDPERARSFWSGLLDVALEPRGASEGEGWQTGGAPAGAAAPAAVADWRGLFTDPKLIAVIETALSENRDLRATVANVRSARAQFEAQRSTLFPTLDAGANAT